jgi:hypothetical protein
MGFHASLNEAAFMGVEAMLTLMEWLFHLDRLEVVALAATRLIFL